MATSGTSRITSGRPLFARCVWFYVPSAPDYATFAFILDDYIEESYRGRGLGKWLMQTIQQHPDLQGLRRWMLDTHDSASTRR